MLREQCCDSVLLYRGSPGISLASTMSVVIGIRSDDRTDLVMAADTRRSLYDRQSGMNLPAGDGALKIVKVNDRICVGIAGAVDLSNIILANVLDVREFLTRQEDVAWAIEKNVPDRRWANVAPADFVASMSVAMDALAEANPPGWAGCVVLVGAKVQDELALFSWTRKVKHIDHEEYVPYAYAHPLPKSKQETEFRRHLLRPGVDIDSRVRAAISYCADLTDTVNTRVVYRRFSNGFELECT